jgi:hypothetical protein
LRVASGGEDQTFGMNVGVTPSVIDFQTLIGALDFRGDGDRVESGKDRGQALDERVDEGVAAAHQ